MPETFEYDENRKVVRVGCGEFDPVSKGLWAFDVSGLKVIQSWLGYRMKRRKGKASSPLDEVRPAEWSACFTTEFLNLLNILNYTLDSYKRQDALLEAVVTGEVLTEGVLGKPQEGFRKAPDWTTTMHLNLGS